MIQALLQKLESLVGSENFEAESEEIIEQLQEAGAGDEIIPLLLQIMERHPLADFRLPGAMVCFMETFDPEYEEYLIESLRRRPTVHTVWMVNRCINVHADKERFMSLLRETMTHPDASPEVRRAALELWEFHADV